MPAGNPGHKMPPPKPSKKQTPVLKHPRKLMPKLKLIRGKQKRLLANNTSITSRPWAKNARFYNTKLGTTLALGTVAKPLVRSVAIVKLNKGTNVFEKYAKCWLQKNFDAIDIYSVLVLGSKKSKTITKTGINVFRLFLNEAIAFARSTGMKKITLSAETKVLCEYYSSLGFKFNHPSNPLEGVFYLT